MLVGRGMEHNVRAVAVEQRVDLFLIADGGDLHLEIQLLAISADQLLLNIVSIILVVIQDEEQAGVELCDLAAELASDGSAAPGHQHRFP